MWGLTGMPQLFINWVIAKYDDSPIPFDSPSPCEMNRSRRWATILESSILSEPAVELRGLANGSSPAACAQLVEPDQLGVGHVDLAADLEQVGRAAVQHERDLADRLQIRRDVVAPLAVAAGRALHELAVLITERDSDAVDLELDDIADRLVGIKSLADAHVPLAKLVVRIGVVDRQHRDRVPDGREAFQRLAADPLGGAVRT